MPTLSDFRLRHQILTKGKCLNPDQTELKAIEQSQEWVQLSDVTNKCFEFLNSIHGSCLMKEYNIASMSYGYKLSRSGLEPSNISSEVVMRKQIEQKFKQVYSQYESKVKKLKEKHQNQVDKANSENQELRVKHEEEEKAKQLIINNLTSELEEKTSELEDSQRENGDKQNLIRQLEAAKKSLKEDMERAKTDADEQVKLYTDEKKSNQELERRIVGLKDTIVSEEAKFDELTQAYEQLKQEFNVSVSTISIISS